MVFQPIEQLRFQAVYRPDAIAIQGFDRAMSFKELWLRIRRIAQKLRASGILPGDVVMTQLEGRLTEWIFSLALLHEATIGAISATSGLPDPALGVRWLIASRQQPAWPSEQVIVIDQAWLDDLPAGDLQPCHYDSGDSVCRLIMTSGTTGHAKAVPFTVAICHARLASLASYWTSSRTELNLMSLGTIGGFMSALNTVMVGMPHFHFRSMDEVVSLILKFGIVHLSGSPTQLADLVRVARERNIAQLPLTLVRSGGGMLSEVLLASLSECTQAVIVNVYGSTEAGGVTALNARELHQEPALAGHLLPNVECQIVDEQGKVMPNGHVGTIRVRSPVMVSGYFRNPSATDSTFRDGWFYPGDTGLLNAQGMLVLAGRSSELINRGGVKLDPVAIDHFIQALPGVRDAAVFGYQGSNGVQRVAAAIVPGPGFDSTALQAAISKQFGSHAIPQMLFGTSSIPRNEMGKVRRAQLAEQLARREQVASAGPGTTDIEE